MIRRTKVKLDDEYAVLSHLIMDKDALRFAYDRYKRNELKTRHFTAHYQPVFRWLIKYYKDYEKAPKRTIQRIFKKKEKYLGKQAELIEEYLTRLSSEYKALQEESSDFVIKELILDFIKRQTLTATMDNIQASLDKGDTDKAEAIALGLTKIEDEDEDLDTIAPATLEDLQDFYSEDTHRDIVYTLAPPLGNIVGPLERGWLMAVTGIEKSGKSYLLQEIGINAAVYQKRKVLTINLELNKKQQRTRVQRRLSECGKDEERVVHAVFDCQNNQFNTCEVRKTPLNKSNLFRSPNEDVNFYIRRRWKPCTKCRGQKVDRNTPITKRFVPKIWFKSKKVHEATEIRVRKAYRALQATNLQNYRVKCFPRFSKSFDEVKDFIKRYIDETQWLPDIIIFDYLDILAPEQGNLQERIDIDRKWKKASQLAGEMNSLVITADQANKASRQQRSLNQMSTSESKTKDSHLDVRLAINQTSDELSLGLVRLSILFHRHASFDPRNEIMATQNLSVANPLLDTSYWPSKEKDIKVFAEKLR